MFSTHTQETVVGTGPSYVSDQHLAGRYSVSRPTIWAWLKKDPSFPKPVKLSPGCTRWRLDEIEAWEQSRAAA
ncbi:helix-turn-helix transcriptional regulator [Haematobacter genomosp. 1]|uniref:AlpA family transcriptional regulator n=1 Tax=Haematobacter genomosp. 1 TaxID=366618 RepID=A0A212A6M8_9RHOB|nr:AlpA family phage regulatory protein [Haematobacter genomosp. 1]OWJ74618.1 AlpA family transcriptional regulator [Haematobacter genomosp. 1]